MGRVIEVIGWVGIVLFVLIVGGGACGICFGFLYSKCAIASEQAERVLVPLVRRVEAHALATSGEGDKLDPKFREPKLGALGSGQYRVVTRRTAEGYEVVIEPTAWCFCRDTYVLRDGGKEMEIVPPLFGRGR
jgi:hypothetical protein